MAQSFDIVAASKVINSRREADFSGTSYVFNPQPDELVLKYLWNKICMKPTPVVDVIKQIVLKFDDLAPDPTQIPQELFLHGPQRRSSYFYIFNPKLGRVTSNGYWNDFVNGEPVVHQLGRETINVKRVVVCEMEKMNNAPDRDEMVHRGLTPLLTLRGGDLLTIVDGEEAIGSLDFSGTGFIFNPQPDVLVLKYLWNKICMKPTPVLDVIKQILLKSDDLAPDATQIPEELFRHGPRRRSAYFYIFSAKLGPEVKERVTSNGNWNDFVSGEPVVHQFGRGTIQVGSVRVLQYSLNNSDSGPHYHMREYRLNPSLIPPAMRYSFINKMVERVVVCEIEKTNNAPDPSHAPRGGGRLTIVDGEEAIGGLNHLLGSAGVGIIY